MRKFTIMLQLLLSCALLVACGDGKVQESPWIGIAPGSDMTAVTERTEYYDLTVETEEIFDLGLWEKNPEEYYVGDPEMFGITVYNLLGTQFAMGEPAQLWSEVTPTGVNICLYRMDGSRELLLSGLVDEECAFIDARYEGYVDKDKNCYLYCTNSFEIDGEYTQVGTVMKILSTGEVSYQSSTEAGYQLKDICQTEDGRIYLLMADYGTRRETLEELNPDTGEVVPESRMEWDFISDGISHLGTAGASLARASVEGIEALDIAAQSASPLLYADGTPYGSRMDWVIQDFRVLEDGTMELLWAYSRGYEYTLDRMRMEKVEKTPIVLRGIFEYENWLSEKVALFNQKSRDYHVVLENCGYGNDVEDYARLTSVQIGAGKGPDILCGNDLLHDYISGMLEKGALEELNSYMEESGIQEEDYFPLVFATWRQEETIYSVTPRMEVYYEEVEAEVLGSGEVPDIEALADALLARGESGVYRAGLASREMLNTFLQGSETLWGMVDWEAGTCSFDVPLFEKLLEAARRYGYTDRKALNPEITEYQELSFFFGGFNSPEEQREKGLVSIGTLFDDGCHAVSYPLYTMAVNANSPNKEGAWEFIAFLLSEEVQYREELYLPPVHKESFDKWLEWEIGWLSEVRYEKGKQLIPVYHRENTSAEKREAYRKAFEDARPLPVQSVPILQIIQEEAEDYFNGNKNAEEVSQVINNRVKLYLNE